MSAVVTPSSSAGDGPIDVVLDRLRRVRRVAQRGWVAECPSHDDARPSLSLSTGENSCVLLKCFAGCATEAVLAAIDLTMVDLFAHENHPVATRRNVRSNPLAQTTDYAVRDEDGDLRAIHIRHDYEDGSKSMPWLHPDRRPVSRLDPLPGGTAGLPLYRSETLMSYDRDETVIVVEGEKAADSLASVWSGPVVATVTGAHGCPDAPAFAVLAGRPAACWPDNDDAGRAHMARVARCAADFARVVGVLDVPGLPMMASYGPRGTAKGRPAAATRGHLGPRDPNTIW